MSEQTATTGATATPTAAPATPSAAGTPVAPTSPTTATAPESTEAGTPDPKFHKAWKGLAAAEKANVEASKAIAADKKTVAQWQTALAIADPVARVEALAELAGQKDLFDQAARAMVSRKRVDPTVTKVQSEVETLRSELAAARALPLVRDGMSPEAIAEELGIDMDALKVLAADKKHGPRFVAAEKAYEERVANQLTHHATQTESWVAAQVNAEGLPEYEMIAMHGAGAKVFALIQQHYEDTFAAGDPVTLSKEDAAGIIEAALLEQSRPLLQKLSAARKLKLVSPATADKPPVQPSPASRPTSPKTLGNAASQESSSTRSKVSGPDREREAVAVLDEIMKRRRAT